MSVVKRAFPFAAIALALTLILAPRRAHACGGGSGGTGTGYAVVAAVGIAGLGLLGTDVGLSVYDVVKAAQGKRASKGVAIAEVALATPQIAVSGWYMLSPYTEKTTTAYVVSAIPVALFLHGMITLAAVDWNAEQQAVPGDAMLVNPYVTSTPIKSEPRVNAPEDRLRVSVAPTMLPGGTADHPTMIPGLGAWGSF